MAKKITPAPVAAEAATEQPYYLQRVHIKDFRSIRNAVVEFKPGLNIIIGENGSGKSNLVECIVSSLTEPKRDFSGETELTIIGSISIQVQASKIVNDTSKALRAAGLLSTTHQQRVILSTGNEVFQAESFLEAQYKLIKSPVLSDNNLPFLRLITIYYGVPPTYSIVSSPITFHAQIDGVSSYSSFEGSLFSDVLASAISSAISQIHFSTASDERLPDRSEITQAIEAVENIYREILLSPLRSVTNIVDIRLTGSIHSYTIDAKQKNTIDSVRMEFQVGQSWLPFSALSSGTQRMFYIISETLFLGYYSEIHSKNQNNPDTILLIEEPELGIHPDQLEKLLIFLRAQSQEHQLILTTHSPQVLDMLNDDELDRISICELHKTNGTQFRKLKKPQLAAAKQYMSTQGVYLSDYWRYGSLESTF